MGLGQVRWRVRVPRKTNHGLLDDRASEVADQKVRMQAAIEELQRGHAALAQRASVIINSWRTAELKLIRQRGDVERLVSSMRQASVLADEAQASGRLDDYNSYSRTAKQFGMQLRQAEAQLVGYESTLDHAAVAADEAKREVVRNAEFLQRKLADRSMLLAELEVYDMTWKVAQVNRGKPANILHDRSWLLARYADSTLRKE